MIPPSWPKAKLFSVRETFLYNLKNFFLLLFYLLII